MTDVRRTIVGLGELLWDLLPSGKQLGGAPANFAYITSLLGDVGIPASRVGADALGDEAIVRLSQLVLDAQHIQRDSVHSTGTVNVKIAADGQPRFEILQPVAWDFLDWTPGWQRLAEKADAVCFGSLAQRSLQNRATIREFLRAAPINALRVFDVNLRQNFYSKEILSDSMKLANIVKMNHEELPKVMQLFGFENLSQTESARQLLSFYELDLICVTRGTNGSLLISANERSEHPGVKVKVADTIGAGDAFTAALVHGYLRSQPLHEINETANRVGAWVASQPGATPTPKGGLQRALAEIA
jgi:fructokinase